MAPRMGEGGDDRQPRGRSKIRADRPRSRPPSRGGGRELLGAPCCSPPVLRAWRGRGRHRPRGSRTELQRATDQDSQAFELTRLSQSGQQSRTAARSKSCRQGGQSFLLPIAAFRFREAEVGDRSPTTNRNVKRPWSEWPAGPPMTKRIRENRKTGLTPRSHPGSTTTSFAGRSRLTSFFKIVAKSAPRSFFRRAVSW